MENQAELEAQLEADLRRISSQWIIAEIDEEPPYSFLLTRTAAR